MPYVQRNWKGEITGLYSGPQPQPDGTSLTDPDPLPDDHPEVVAFREKQPLPDDFLKPISFEDVRLNQAQFEDLVAEHKAIRDTVGAFHHRFSELELALGNLLYVILNIQNSRLAHAIYYSPTSFDARAEIVTNAIIQIATEQKPLYDLIPLWEKVSEKIGQSRRLRNAIAHSAPLTHNIGNKPYARLSPPAFDVIRVGRTLAKRQIPGLSANDIIQGCNRLTATVECVDHVNRLVTEFHEGNPSLQKRYDALKRGLTKFRNP